jgi:hypothetical protein
MEYGGNSSLNVYFYGSRTEKSSEEYTYQTDALSANTQLNPNLWGSMRRYRVEWLLPDSDPEGYGYVRWFFDDVKVHFLFIICIFVVAIYNRMVSRKRA